MIDLAKKKAANARRHRERMANDLPYRMRKLLATIRARCYSGKGRNDWEYYGAKGLQVTITVDDLVVLWHRDGADSMVRPDCDRKESSKGYTLDNCQFIEHADNLKKMHATRRPRRWKKRPEETHVTA